MPVRVSIYDAILAQVSGSQILELSRGAKTLKLASHLVWRSPPLAKNGGSGTDAVLD